MHRPLPLLPVSILLALYLGAQVVAVLMGIASIPAVSQGLGIAWVVLFSLAVLASAIRPRTWAKIALMPSLGLYWPAAVIVTGLMSLSHILENGMYRWQGWHTDVWLWASYWRRGEHHDGWIAPSFEEKVAKVGGSK